MFVVLVLVLLLAKMLIRVTDVRGFSIGFTTG